MCHKQDWNLGLSQIAVFDDFKATALTTQPPWMDRVFQQHKHICQPFHKQMSFTCKKQVLKQLRPPPPLTKLILRISQNPPTKDTKSPKMFLKTPKISSKTTKKLQKCPQKCLKDSQKLHNFPLSDDSVTSFALAF